MYNKVKPFEICPPYRATPSETNAYRIIDHPYLYRAPNHNRTPQPTKKCFHMEQLTNISVENQQRLTTERLRWLKSERACATSRDRQIGRTLRREDGHRQFSYHHQVVNS